MFKNEVATKYRFHALISKIWQEFTAIKTTGTKRCIEDSCSVLCLWKRCLNNKHKEVKRISHGVNIHHLQGKKRIGKNRKKEKDSRKGKQTTKPNKQKTQTPFIPYLLS